MQQFQFEQQGNEVRLSEDEARALAALHAKRRELQSQPSIKDMASQLGVSEAEVMAMLTEIRAKSPVVPPVSQPVVTVPHAHRGMSSTAWALVSLAAAVVVIVVGLFVFRGLMHSSVTISDGGAPATAMPSEAPVATMPPPIPIAPNSPSTGAVTMEGDENHFIIRTPGVDMTFSGSGADKASREAEQAQLQAERKAKEAMANADKAGAAAGG